MTEFLQHLVNGVSVGTIYALIALGYTMVYGVLKLINFAHSEIFMIGAVAGVEVFRYLAPLIPNGYLLLLVAVGLVSCMALGTLASGNALLSVVVTALVGAVATFLAAAGLNRFGSGSQWQP